MAKKTELEENIEAVETEEVETPKKSGWKVWTEEELAVLPRDKFLKIEADIRDGKARVVQK